VGIQSGKYDIQIDSGAIARFGHTESDGRTMRFLLEPDNYVVGQVVVLDRGLSLRCHRGWLPNA
jgi:hypothetical protein